MFGSATEYALTVHTEHRYIYLSLVTLLLSNLSETNVRSLISWLASLGSFLIIGVTVRKGKVQMTEVTEEVNK